MDISTEPEETLILNDINDFEEIYDETTGTRVKNEPLGNAELENLKEKRIASQNNNIWRQDDNNFRLLSSNSLLHNQVTNCNINVENSNDGGLKQAVINCRENNDNQNNKSAITKITERPIKKEISLEISDEGNLRNADNTNVLSKNIKTEKESLKETVTSKCYSKQIFETDSENKFKKPRYELTTSMKVEDDINLESKKTSKKTIGFPVTDVSTINTVCDLDYDHLEENMKIKSEELHIKSEETFTTTEDVGKKKKARKKPQPKDKSTEVYRCAEPNCGYSSFTKSHFERHLLVHMKPEDCRMFKCQYCDYESKYKRHTKVHEELHTNAGHRPFECGYCHMKFKTKLTMKSHVKHIHTSTETYHCFHCDMKTKNRHTLVTHIQKLHRSKEQRQLFECTECSFKTHHKDYLKQHAKRHENVAKTISFNCTQCPFTTLLQDNLRHHIKRNHERDSMKLHKCDLCSFETIYRNNLKIHKTHMHESSQGADLFNCPECNKEFKHKSGMTAHMLRMHSDVTAEFLKCANCYYKTRNKSSMARHMRLNHLREEMKCPHCKFVTIKNAVLKKHVDSHKDDKHCFVCKNMPRMLEDPPYGAIPVPMSISDSTKVTKQEATQWTNTEKKAAKERFCRSSNNAAVHVTPGPSATVSIIKPSDNSFGNLSRPALRCDSISHQGANLKIENEESRRKRSSKVVTTEPEPPKPISPPLIKSDTLTDIVIKKRLKLDPSEATSQLPPEPNTRTLSTPISNQETSTHHQTTPTFTPATPPNLPQPADSTTTQRRVWKYFEIADAIQKTPRLEDWPPELYQIIRSIRPPNVTRRIVKAFLASDGRRVRVTIPRD